MNRARPIAIVGIGCRFPGNANSPDELWDLLLAGRNAIVDVPSSRWDKNRYLSKPLKPGRISVNRAGCLENVDGFDAEFFGISPRIAERMDPQQRLLLEVTWATDGTGASFGDLKRNVGALK